MKRHLQSPLPRRFAKNSLIATLIVCAVGSGCQLKTAAEKAKEQSSAQSQSQGQTQAQTKAQETAAAVERAKQELRGRVSLYGPLVGEYDGIYIADENSTVDVKVTVSLNAPAEAELERMDRENEILNRVDAITLDVQTEENLEIDQKHSFFCYGHNIKPDFSQGQVRFDCAGGEKDAIPPRTYVLSFDSGDGRIMTGETADRAKAISAQIGTDLVSGRQTSLGGFRLSIIMNPQFGYQFNGILTKRNSASN